MNIKHSYILYCNNIPTSIETELSNILANIEPKIHYEIIDVNKIKGEASRGIPPIGISLYCYFITNKVIDYKPIATKTYDNGIGCGIGLLNIDLDNFPKQFSFVSSVDDTIELIKDKFIESILFCEKYIDIKF